MKHLPLTKRVLLAVVFTLLGTVGSFAQDSLKVDISADLVSRYVWRGMDQNSGVSLQPDLSLSYKGLSLEAWSSASLANTDIGEVDIILSYEVGDFKASMTDYYWNSGTAKYGDYKKDHYFELGLTYTISERAPLTLNWNTILFGGKAWELDEEDKRMFSSYFNVAYEFDVHGVSLTPAIGINPWTSQYAEDFKLMDITLTASKDFKITDNWTLPVWAQFIAAPETNKAYVVVGISF